ncbi:MAG TPA: hypothetical protein VG756_04055 [Pseudonocardiaceae bacterium]|nr:hypothetical protein [Pseudonocardiaceae bacterium]
MPGQPGVHCSGDEYRALVASGVPPGRFDLGQRHGAGVDRAGALVDLGGRRGQFGENVLEVRLAALLDLEGIGVI